MWVSVCEVQSGAVCHIIILWTCWACSWWRGCLSRRGRHLHLSSTSIYMMLHIQSSVLETLVMSVVYLNQSWISLTSNTTWPKRSVALNCISSSSSHLLNRRTERRVDQWLSPLWWCVTRSSKTKMVDSSWNAAQLSSVYIYQTKIFDSNLLLTLIGDLYSVYNALLHHINYKITASFS